MRLSAQGCVVTQSLIQHRSYCIKVHPPVQVEMLTYCVYAPLSIHGTPCLMNTLIN
jgi:hypothetical protein